MFGFETSTSIYDMGKSETEYDKNMIHSRKIISQLLSDSITLTIRNTYYHKGKKLDNILMISDYTSFFTDTSGLNTQYLHNVHCYYAGKKKVALTHAYISKESLNNLNIILTRTTMS